MRWILIAALPLTLLGAACSKKSDDGPSCDKVVDNMMAVTKQQLSGHGGIEVQNKKAMVEQCLARKMPAEQRQCLATAKDLTGIAGCSKPPAAAPK